MKHAPEHLTTAPPGRLLTNKRLAAVRDEVRRALLAVYGPYCAYCERLVKDEKRFEIDHYRPTGQYAAAAPQERHKGYPWLETEWTNLVLSCRDCNGDKRSRFPVLGQRVAAPPSAPEDYVVNCAAMLQEKAALLHPALHNPHAYFRLKEDGDLEGVDKEGHGALTIEILNLNEDRNVVASSRELGPRGRIVDGFIDSCAMRLEEFMARKEAEIDNLGNDIQSIFCRKIKQNRHKSYSFAVDYIWQYPEEFVAYIVRRACGCSVPCIEAFLTQAIEQAKEALPTSHSACH